MKYDYHVVVIGAGISGRKIAWRCCELGAKTAIIEKNSSKNFSSCKSIITCEELVKIGNIAGIIKESPNLGIYSKIDEIDITKIMEKIRKKIEEYDLRYSIDKLLNKGIEVFYSDIKIIDKRRIKLEDNIISCKYIVVSSVATPEIPEIKGINEVEYFTSENIIDLKKLPKHIAILGSDTNSIEIGQAFKNLGSRVTIINRKPNIFTEADAEVDGLMREAMKNEGINILYYSTIKEAANFKGKIILNVSHGYTLKELECDAFMILEGYTANSQNAGLEEIGVDCDSRGFIITNKKMQTNIKNIYACSDVAGKFAFSCISDYQADVIIRNIIFFPKFKIDYSCVPITTFTNPIVSRVGLTETMAKNEKKFNRSIFINLNENKNNMFLDKNMGFCKIVLSNKNKIIGGTIVGNEMYELMPLISMAVKHKKRPEYLKSIPQMDRIKYEAINNIYMDYVDNKNRFKYLI